MEEITYEVVERRVVDAGELDVNLAFYENPGSTQLKGRTGVPTWLGRIIPFQGGSLIWVPAVPPEDL